MASAPFQLLFLGFRTILQAFFTSTPFSQLPLLLAHIQDPELGALELHLDPAFKGPTEGLQQLARLARQRLRRALLAAQRLQPQGERRQQPRGGRLQGDARGQGQGVQAFQQLGA